MVCRQSVFCEVTLFCWYGKIHYMKFWKNWPYWLRGGVIGGGITFIFVTLFYSCSWLTPPDSWACLIPLFVSPMFPVAVLFDNKFFSNDIPFVLLPVFSVTIWFFVGTLIGAFVGYLKSKKNNVVQ